MLFSTGGCTAKSICAWLVRGTADSCGNDRRKQEQASGRKSLLSRGNYWHRTNLSFLS